jgi:hypothetical protein
MKKLNIILSVVLFTCTTVLLTVLPVAVSLDLGQWAVLACLILMGYTGAYLYFDNYVDFIIREQRHDVRQSYQQGYGYGYDMGHYDGYREGRSDKVEEQLKKQTNESNKEIL